VKPEELIKKLQDAPADAELYLIGGQDGAAELGYRVGTELYVTLYDGD
jgi:hypothetical protein